jgi:hypothetical protein
MKMRNKKLKTNYPKTIFNIIINLCLTLWLFLFFILELNEFFNSIKNPDGSYTQTIPLLSTLGIIAWFGLTRKKQWGLSCFQGYIIFTIGYQLIDLVFNFEWATITQIVLTLPISILLYFHFRKNAGFVWLIKN